jgi:hypothetical protein
VSTSTPDTVPAPAAQQPAPRRGLGNVRSLVISLVVIIVAVLAWVAMVPRVREISQPAVDVSSVARQVRQETGWAISQPRLPAGWKATNARFDSAADGARTWHAGYLSPDGQYLSIDQTEGTGASASWISGRTSQGQAEGTISAAGRMWQELSSRVVVQRSLVSKDPGAPGLTTVLSGTAPYAQLAQFAQTLEPVPSS